MDEKLCCAHCGDVIGVYEPLVVFYNGQTRITSTTAEREHDGPSGQRYHEACYTQLTDRAIERQRQLPPISRKPQ